MRAAVSILDFPCRSSWPGVRPGRLLFEIRIPPLLCLTSDFRLQAVFFVIATIGNLHYTNVRKCPVLSGLRNAIPVITINPLYQQDLQQFPSPSRPDISQIGAALRPIARRCHGSAGRASVPQCLRGEICPNVRFCPVLSGLYNAIPVFTTNPL